MDNVFQLQIRRASLRFALGVLFGKISGILPLYKFNKSHNVITGQPVFALWL